MAAINATLSQYDAIPKTLKEAQAICSAEVSVPAAGLLRSFQDPSTVMCLTMAQHAIDRATGISESIIAVSKSNSCWNAIESAKAVKSQLQRMCEAAEFDKILNDVESKIKVLHLEELSVLRARRSTRARFCDVGGVFQTKSVCKYFRIE